jgi:hypothetical protein
MRRFLIIPETLAIAVFLIPSLLAGESGQASAPKEVGVDPAALQAIKGQIEALKADYEKRLKELEAQVEALQLQLLRSTQEAPAAATPAPAAQSIPGALNPALTVVGNFVARGDSQKIYNEQGMRIDNKPSLRETELDLRAAIDPYADGVFIASIASESPGSYSAGVEEAYAVIKKLPFQGQPPLGLKLKVGRFRPSFGANNILHTHDLPQTMRPLPVQEFLGEEGFIQSGVSGSFFLPTPWDRRSSLEGTLQVLAGGDLAFSPSPSARTAYLGHVNWFRSFRSTHNLSVGWSSYFHPEGNEVMEADFHGLDFTYRWNPLRRGQWKSFVASAELMFARRSIPEAAGVSAPAAASPAIAPGKPFGFTLFGQWQFNRRLYAGLRWDRTDVLYDPALKRRSLTPYVSYYFSEFLRFRLNYEQRWSDLTTEDRRKSVFAELNFVFGSHPPEPYWVNK